MVFGLVVVLIPTFVGRETRRLDFGWTFIDPLALPSLCTATCLISSYEPTDLYCEIAKNSIVFLVELK